MRRIRIPIVIVKWPECHRHRDLCDQSSAKMRLVGQLLGGSSENAFPGLQAGCPGVAQEVLSYFCRCRQQRRLGGCWQVLARNVELSRKLPTYSDHRGMFVTNHLASAFAFNLQKTSSASSRDVEKSTTTGDAQSKRPSDRTDFRSIPNLRVCSVLAIDTVTFPLLFLSSLPLHSNDASKYTHG